MHKFEQVSSDHHQVSLAGENGRSPGLMSSGGYIPSLMSGRSEG